MDTKQCSLCKQTLPAEAFHKNERSSTGLQSRCKECTYLKHKEWRERNPERYRRLQKKARSTGLSQLPRIRDWLGSYLLEHKCVDCGNSNILVLEFDHVRGEKKFNIGVTARNMSKRRLSELQEEVEKCDVVCANCHKIRTAYQRNSWRLGLL